MAESAQNLKASSLAKLVIDQGLATPEEVETSLQQAKDRQASLAETLVASGVVTRNQIHRLKSQLEDQRSSTEEKIPGYQMMKKLGAGAMAVVYLGRQVSLDRLVAIKILPKKFTNSPEFVDRFYAEGRAAAKLNHPNIVGALDVGKSGEYHYFVMEYVAGHTVHDDLVTHHHYTEKEALDVIMQIGRGLEHAHKAGFIHRDVKPKNIMITDEGIAKLADMGLARAVDDREAAEAEKGKAFGTPYYISPEQIRGTTDVDFRADIYGLGATFYHLVTGQVPFDGPNPSAVMHKHLKQELVPPDHINPNLTAGVSEIIEVCMAKDRNKRYKTTSDLLADLEAVMRGEAPLQARQKFDLNSLAAIEEAGEAVSRSESEAKAAAKAELPLALNPQTLFWVAAGGWGAAVILLIVLLAVIFTS